PIQKRRHRDDARQARRYVFVLYLILRVNKRSNCYLATISEERDGPGYHSVTPPSPRTGPNLVTTHHTLTFYNLSNLICLNNLFYYFLSLSLLVSFFTDVIHLLVNTKMEQFLKQHSFLTVLFKR